MDRKWRANVDPAPNCPRCASTTTKFCYYNNYSLSQPRFFCKGCGRYWTKGGSLRRIPVGGGCRKRSRSGSTKVCNLEEHPSSACPENSVGADIDMAAVFAKFLNNEQGNISQEITEVENTTSSEDSRDSLTSSSAGMGYSNGFDPQIFSDNFLVPDQNQLQAEGAVEGFINPDFASFDDIIKDVFWSNDSNISSQTCQPAAQAQAEGVLDLTLLPADQYDIRPDPIPTDNWDFFDDLEFEVLSLPWKFSQYS